MHISRGSDIRSRSDELDRAADHGARRLPGEGGFALIAALLALVILGGLATAGFHLATTDYQITRNHSAVTRAFYAAAGSLEQFLGGQSGPPADTTSYRIHADSAEVIATPLLEADSLRSLYLLTARGHHLPGTGDEATRTVGAVALLEFGSITVPGALASGVPLHKNGGSGEMSGYDAATGADCPQGGQAARAGLVVPPGGYIQTSGDTVPEGDPPILEQDPLVTLESTGIDWEGITDGTALDFDYYVPGDPWPDFASLPADEYPIVYADSAHMEVGPGDSGQGTLIVRGDLTMNGSFHWDGLLLVGGSIQSDGNQIIHGGAVSALNLLLGETVPDNDLGNGTKTFRFDSCALYYATRELASFSAEPGSWYERM